MRETIQEIREAMEGILQSIFEDAPRCIETLLEAHNKLLHATDDLIERDVQDRIMGGE